MFRKTFATTTITLLCAYGPAVFAQSAAPNVCPFGSELIVKASDSYAGSKGSALATLIWLEQGDDIWLRRNSDPKFLKSRYVTILSNYKYGSNGYPKNKKISKKLERYTEANGEARQILPRPKNVPSAPPQSAIHDAEATLNCRYMPDAKLTETPSARSSRNAERELCSMTYSQAEARRRPHEMVVKRDDNDGYKKALAILEWKLRGPDLFDKPDENGDLFPIWQKYDLRKLFITGESFVVPPQPDMFAAIDQHLAGGTLDAVLSVPSNDMVYWAEDLLMCRYDDTEWHLNMQARLQARRDETAKRIALRQEEERLTKEGHIRKAEYDRKLIEFADNNQNCQSEYEKIFFAMSGKPLPNAQSCKTDCSPGFSDVTPEQIDYAFSCEKAQDRGLVSKPPVNQRLVTSANPNGEPPYSLQDAFKEMSRAIACDRKERRCVSDSQYQRCKIVTVNIC